ncbi:MAG: methyltransferase domain-containing protein [Gammaproteobacteria bacterium]|nr:methyltransferase domain-containing protein [Gammaproteobacteria bacterium]
MKLEEIKHHWQKSGESFPSHSKVTPTSRDPYLGELERENILSYLNREHACLEVGCGDAFHTIHYAKKVKRILGIDVADSLINIAKERKLQRDLLNNIDFDVCSVLDIGEKFDGERFDCVISQRCLINLPTWDHQKEAISQIHRLLTDEGIFLLTEGFQDYLDTLNSARTRFSLPEIKVVDYNRNFVLNDFEEFIQQYFEIVEQRHYGPYLFFSRIYHPLAALPDSPKHDSKLNEVAMNISRVLSMSDLEKYSYNLFYALKRRELASSVSDPQSAI